jgi:hypothetical protein
LIFSLRVSWGISNENISGKYSRINILDAKNGR